jgi:hypothetical protein
LRDAKVVLGRAAASFSFDDDGEDYPAYELIFR